MRILHTADWHLGRTLEGRSRLAEQERFLDELVLIANETKADLILMAGDVYDSVNPPAAAEMLFYDAAARLSQHGRKLVAIAGNHDQPERIASVTPLVTQSGIILTGLPTKEAVRVHIPRTDEEAVIACLPYPSEARLQELLAGDEDEQGLRLAYSERVGQMMRQLASSFTPHTVNLAMSHIYVLGGLESDSERPIQIGGAYTVDPSALDIGAQYTALGHLHRAQAVKSHSKGPIRYSGSPLAYSFSEAGQAKSVMMLDVKPCGEVIQEEIFLSSGRPLVRWSCTNGLQEVQRWLEEGRDAQAFIDLEIRLTKAMSLGDIQALRKAHEGIIHIRPVFPEREASLSAVGRSQMPIQDMFRKFYQRQTGGAEAEQEMVDLFMHLVAHDEIATTGEGES
ncbi:exonuclease SbcD [Paenibacillus shirakamiensis]|uniref:Nuclease SbcCD subunit D n=1 Tax=Paenibacillus shirakamiensis TaxID=1265935 RepID=A0ABS4JBQ9_9BACL|nr:exonuclease SbcCD subunit D [Paenibacillus shirakamiensis]MBP1999158.1 exonuclease SbcD [Paenibacillus shirakamiensis]